MSELEAASASSAGFAVQTTPTGRGDLVLPCSALFCTERLEDRRVRLHQVSAVAPSFVAVDRFILLVIRSLWITNDSCMADDLN